MPIEKLEAEHRRILEMAEALETTAAGPHPQTSAAFIQTRWNFAREVLSHLSNDEALVVAPLMRDRRPHIAQLATQSRAQLRQLCDAFEAHVERWKALPSAQEWPHYRRDLQALVRRLHARVAAEETGIYHFMPVQRSDRQAPELPINYAGGTSRIHDAA